MRRRPWLAAAGLAAVILFAGGTAAATGPSTASAAPNATGASAVDGGTGAPAAPPDAGASPQTGGPVVPPSTGSTPGSTGLPAAGTDPTGPLSSRIATQTVKVQTLAEQAKQAQDQTDTAQSNVDAAKRNLDLAKEEMNYFQGRAGDNGSKAYRSAAKIPRHLDPSAREYRQLAKLAPWLAEPGTVQGSSAGASYRQAKKLYAAADAAYQKALKDQRTDKDRYASLRKQLDQAKADLKKLQDQNNASLSTLQQQQQQAAQRYRGTIGGAVDGMQANAKALAAVRFAVHQVGKPYVWGAEGPNAYDCSGLVLDSYQHAGVALPRIADQQYRATAGSPVPLSKLLPGDLVFYGNTPGVSTSIYHVAMYVGHGKIVQAPTFGIPVQVVPLSLGGFYGATRVVPAVEKKPTKPKPPASPGPSPSGTSPSPSPSGSTGATPGGPSTSPSGSTSPSTSPSGGDGDGTSPSPSCSASPSPSGSGSPSPSPSPSPSGSASPSPTC
ncbi:C40 family peptidase [Actinocatenispora sera]|uniref:C40 family peptidase n=1 Tax=Actinocatenispora sera TaxID=390989 RepID=UPI0033F26076